MKTIDIKKIIAANISNEQIGIEEHRQIIEYLKPYEGKTINGNIFKKLPEHMRFVAQFGMFYIKFKKTGHEHLIGYNSYPVVNINTDNGNGKGIEYFDRCYGNAAIERVKWLNDLTANSENFNRFCALFINIDKAYKNLDKFVSEAKKGEFSSYKNPVYYTLMRSIFPDHIFKAI